METEKVYNEISAV